MLSYLYLDPYYNIYRPYCSSRNTSLVYFRTSFIYITQLQLLPLLTAPLLTIALLWLVLIVFRFIANYTTLLGLQKLPLELYLNILSFTFITLPILLIFIYRLIRSLIRTFYGVLPIYYIRLVILFVRTNLIARVSQIQGHEIYIVLYARLDNSNCQLYKADYMVYILMRLPPNQLVLYKCTRRISKWLVH